MQSKTYTSNYSKISFIVVCHLLFTKAVIYSPSQTGEYRHDLHGISAFRSYALLLCPQTLSEVLIYATFTEPVAVSTSAFSDIL